MGVRAFMFCISVATITFVAAGKTCRGVTYFYPWRSRAARTLSARLALFFGSVGTVFWLAALFFGTVFWFVDSCGT
jgi:hypothetical protein